MNEALIQRILRSPPLPSLPRVAVEVLNLAQDPDVAVPAIARVVSRDPALAAKILRTVNSSAYGLSHTIGTIDRALVVLGLEGVKTLVLGFSLVNGLRKAKAKGGFDHVAYWRRSLYAGAAAKVLADEVRIPLVEEAFLAALLMDVGMLALDRVLGAEYGAVTLRAKAHEALSRVEAETLGMTHADAAAVLAERWKLPPVLAVSMSHHHKPLVLEDETLREVAEVVWLAGRVADVFVDAEPEWPLAEVRRTCLERYGLTELQCGSILARVGMRTRELAPLFEIPLAADRDYETVLKRASEGLAKLTRDLPGGAAAAAGPAAPARPATSPQDMRRAPRVAREGFLIVYPVRPGQKPQGLRAQFRDASSLGIGLQLPTPLQPGEQFVVRLPRKDGEPATILYSVVRCEQTSPDDYRVGAELVCVLRKQPGDPLAATAGA
jgi:HD-like signal output (HDOD) protein